MRNSQDRSTLCLDANLIFRLVTGELSTQSSERIQTVLQSGRKLIAPPLIRYELANAIYQSVRAGHISIANAKALLVAAFEVPIELIVIEHMHIRALELAHHYELRATYDAHYLAVAESEGCEFWTADRRLFNSVSQHLPWVVLVE